MTISFFANSFVYADVLGEAINAEACSDSDSIDCAGVCTQVNNIITIATTGTDDGGVTDAGSGNLKDNCNEKPDEYRITFYKAGICKTNIFDAAASSNPTIAPNCYNFFIDANGKAITLKHDNASGAITQDGSLINSTLNFELGTYNYAYVIVDNHLEVKHEQTFSEAMQGYSAGGSFSVGTTCWTNGVVTTYTNATNAQRGYTAEDVKSFGADGSAKTSLAFTCGNTDDASPIFNTEIIENMSENPGSENENFSAVVGSGFSEMDGTSDKAAGKLLLDDDLTTATSHANAARIFLPNRIFNSINCDSGNKSI